MLDDPARQYQRATEDQAHVAMLDQDDSTMRMLSAHHRVRRSSSVASAMLALNPELVS
jgi:hypothetical protein